MSHFTPSIDMLIQRATKEQRDQDPTVILLSDVRVGKRHVSRPHDGLVVIIDVDQATEFKVFEMPDKLKKNQLQWALALKPSDELTATLWATMNPGAHRIASIRIDLCRLVHKGHHDGGYVLTFHKGRLNGDIDIPFPPDPAANPFGRYGEQAIRNQLKRAK